VREEDVDFESAWPAEDTLYYTWDMLRTMYAEHQGTMA
jgi:hypothetical protein